MIPKITLATLVLMIMGCGVRNEREAVLFTSNVSQKQFDRSLFNVFVNNQLILSDSVNNQYLSSHWKEAKIKIPADDFELRVAVIGEGFRLEKDTVVGSADSMKLFVRFNFSPYYKRYKNPEIYRYLPSETTRFKEIADSLYAGKVLLNSSEYLNDTFPLQQHLEISIE